MMKNKKYLLLILLPCLLWGNNSYAKTPKIGKEGITLFTVDQNSNNGFTTIQSAIDASAKSKEVIIFIKPGLYKEKLFITRNNISLIGSSVKNTTIEYAELRNNWRKEHTSDWGAAVININATNVNIVNLRVINNYGRLHNTDEHQFAIRGFENSSKIILHQCNIIADGADTVSLWNKNNGMYYHSYCNFEGYTDMVCPRGWALIENSSFFNKKHSATLWHDGEKDQDQKLVINNSTFDGIEGFWLGRHHYDAQFYLLNSTFSKNMADKPLFKKRYGDINKNRANLYGDRYFFFNNQDENNYPWLRNNITPEKTHLKHATMEEWVFNNKWKPNKVIAQLDKLIKSTQFVADDLHINN